MDNTIDIRDEGEGEQPKTVVTSSGEGSVLTSDAASHSHQLSEPRCLNDHPMESEEILQILGRYGRYQLLVFFLISFVCMRGVWHLFGTIFLAADPGHYCNVPINATINATILYQLNDAGEVARSQCSMYVDGDTNNTQPCTEGWQYGDGFQSVLSEWDFVCDRSYMTDLSSSVFMAGMIIGSLCISPLADKFGRKTILLSALWVQGVFGVATAFVNSPVLFLVMRFFLGALNQSIGLVAYVLVPEAFPSSSRTVPYIGLFLFWSGGIMSLALLGYLIRDWRYLELAISIPNFLTIIYFWLLPESIPWLMAKQKFKEAEAVIRKAAKLNGIELPKEILNLASSSTTKCLAPASSELTDFGGENRNMSDFHQDKIPSEQQRASSDEKHSYNRKKLVSEVGFLENTNGVSLNKYVNLGQTSAETTPVSNKHSNNIDDNRIDCDHSTNGVASPSVCEEFRGAEQQPLKPTSYTIIDLFRSPRIRIYSLITFYLWLVNSLSYFGISFLVPVLHGDIFINLFISGVVEIPAYLLCMATVECLGRRRPISVFMLVCGVSNIIAIFVPDRTEGDVDLLPLRTTLAMISKFGITGAYVTVYLFCLEIYPTVVRNLGVGIAAAFETAGAVAAPFIASSAKSMPQLPLTIFGVLTVIGGILCLVLPETHRKRLPETIEEVESWNRKSGEKAVKGR